MLNTPLADERLYTRMVEAFRGYLGLADPREAGYELVQQVVDMYDKRRAAEKAA
jgi:hypothetical protein